MDFIQLSASDADQGMNSRILYHIVDGNPDNAFTISPPYSGIVQTNIVLDREIREKYRLTIIATDQGNPQLTGTAALSIRVIDINDNQPTFPEHSIVSASEGKRCHFFLPIMPIPRYANRSIKPLVKRHRFVKCSVMIN